jgi:hypothetical protein
MKTSYRLTFMKPVILAVYCLNVILLSLTLCLMQPSIKFFFFLFSHVAVFKIFRREDIVEAEFLGRPWFRDMDENDELLNYHCSLRMIIEENISTVLYITLSVHLSVNIHCKDCPWLHNIRMARVSTWALSSCITQNTHHVCAFFVNVSRT